MEVKNKKKTVLVKPSGVKQKKKLGRPVHWLKNPPPHLKKIEIDPELILSIKETENQWREMRRKGITSDYFELCDITDPELMGHDVVDWDEAIKIPKYKAALKKIDEAKKRNKKQIQSAAQVGARNSKLNADARREYLKEYLHAELYTTKEFDNHSIRAWADHIFIKEAMKPKSKRWDGERISKPGATHLRGILKSIRDNS
jgi:hypothetical protein